MIGDHVARALDRATPATASAASGEGAVAGVMEGLGRTQTACAGLYAHGSRPGRVGCRRCRSTCSTEPTSCSGRGSARRPRSTPDARSARPAVVLRSLASLLRTRRGHPRRRRVRPRDRVVPQRPVPRLQDRRGHRAEDLFAQFELAERAAAALGLRVWPMVEFEADDAIATAAARTRGRSRASTRVVIAAVDKDMCQCVIGAARRVLGSLEGRHARRARA